MRMEFNNAVWKAPLDYGLGFALKNFIKRRPQHLLPWHDDNVVGESAGSSVGLLNSSATE